MSGSNIKVSIVSRRRDLERKAKFTDYTDPAYPPRTIVHLTINYLLVSRIFKCEKCGFWLSHDPSILVQMQIECPFLLYHIAGVSAELFIQIINLASEGI
jgi:hypothetical protein